LKHDPVEHEKPRGSLYTECEKPVQKVVHEGGDMRVAREMNNESGC